MRRREFIALLGGAAAAWPRAARAQAPSSVPRLSYVWLGDAGTDGRTKEGFQQGLRDFGYEESRTIIVDYHYAGGQENRLVDVLAKIVRGKTDLIVTPGTIATRAARNATRTIPVVSASGDPVAAGFATSLAHPGHNITGLTINAGPEIAGKWIEILHEAIPSASRIAFLWSATSTVSAAYLSQMTAVAGQVGATLSPHGVPSAEHFSVAFDAIARDGVDALIVDADPLTDSYRNEIVAFATARRLPAVYGLRDFVDAGGLMSYDASLTNVWRRAAFYVDKILKGAKPADLPIERPTKFELVINLKTAKALSLEIPPTLLARADEVIE
jgi:putative tryptophan/tyrosine transport system substrate-binding protein